jgi:hypothetical protein
MILVRILSQMAMTNGAKGGYLRDVGSVDCKRKLLSVFL